MCYALFFVRRVLNPVLFIVLFPLKCLARALTRQRLKNLFYILLLYAVTLICLYAACQFLPYSLFYHLYSVKTLNYGRIQDLNNERRFEAQKVLLELNKTTTHQYLHNARSTDLRYAIGVVTVNRKVYRNDVGPLDYLTQVMTKLHRIIAKNEATGRIIPFMCNVDLDPESHKEAVMLGNYFPNVTKVYSPLYSYSSIRKTVQEKEKQDYVFCLESALEFKADYVILLEDDAYPNDDFYQVSEHLMETKLESKIDLGDRIENNEQWGWVKLMIPYSLTKYHRNWFFSYQWIALTLFLSGTCCLIYTYATTTHYFKKYQITPSFLSSLLFLLFTFLYFLMIIFIIGRPYYVQMRTFSRFLYALEPGTSCCTQAVLYKPAEVPGILDFLKKTACSRSFPLDFALEEYRIENKLKQYLVSPNLFSHIGFYSSIHQSFNQNEAEFI